MIRNYTIYLILLLSMIAPVWGAVISGTVYDSSLETLDNAVVEINTVPHQKILSKAGTYSFEVPPGEYIITASNLAEGVLHAYTEENLTIVDDGVYIVDLFTFPDLASDELNDDEELFELAEALLEDDPEPQQSSTPIGFGIVLIIVVIAAVVLYMRKKPKHDETINEDEDIAELVALLKKHGGRMTQKEIRREIPLSEAKISLMITELESNGVVKKIKKGRGNVIILQKK